MKKTVYIFSDGELHRKDNTIFFETDNKKKYLPIEDIGELMIMGEVNMNKRFLELVSQKEILVHYFNHYGYYVGTFYPREHLNSGYMVLKQAEHYSCDDKRLALAREFVIGAIKNILQVLKYYGGRGKDVGGETSQIIALLSEIDRQNAVAEVMALEGNARNRYYQAWDKIIDSKDFVFEQRSRRPPLNHLNCLISFTNSILYTMVLSEIYHTHLDPRIGYLHSTNFRRFSLNLDVAEIFKPIIVDRVIFSLLAKKMITAKDFEKETGGIVLKEKGRKALVEELENKLTTTIKHRTLKNEVTYRRLIRLELYKLEKHLRGEAKYSGFVAQW